jgi:hypothetical protein
MEYLCDYAISPVDLPNNAGIVWSRLKERLCVVISLYV